MYNSYGYGTTSPPLTNNPFIDRSASTSQRFPDISQTSSVWASHDAPAQYQQPQPQPPPQQQQPQPQWLQQTTTTASAYYTPFSVSPSITGQGIVSGSSYGYLNPQNATQQQQQQQMGYNPAQQQLQQNPNYIPQLDPYSAIAQGWGSDPSSQSQPLQTQATSGVLYSQTTSVSSPSAPSSQMTTSLSAAGDQHPREYIRVNKAKIEAWDSVTWGVFLGLFEKLRVAWEARKTELHARVEVVQRQANQLQAQIQLGALGPSGSVGAYQGYMQLQGLQGEVARLQGLAKEAESYSETISASTFQMREVFQGYRQSGDLASKRRVREATNASLKSMPDWPGQFV